jgi:hypothetical protein
VLGFGYEFSESNVPPAGYLEWGVAFPLWLPAVVFAALPGSAGRQRRAGGRGEQVYRAKTSYLVPA